MIKNKSFAFRAIVLLIAYLLSACGASGLQSAGSQEKFVEESQSQDVAYTGVVEAISGSQWIINGVEVTVEPSVIQGGPFIVGDTVKVEGMVRSDGVLVVVQLESPTAADLTGLPGLGDSVDTVADDDNSNSNNNTNGDDDDNTNGNANSNINGDDDDDDNTNGNANINTNGDDDDDDDNTNGNANNNTNGDDDDDDDNNNNNTNDDDDDDGNNNINGDDDDDDNSNGS